MANTITLKATDGSTVQFVDEVIGSGAMKDVYFSPDKSYVVGFSAPRRMRMPRTACIISPAYTATRFSISRAATIGINSSAGLRSWWNGKGNSVW